MTNENHIFPRLFCVRDTDDVKQNTSLLSVKEKICLLLFHGVCSFVIHHLWLVREVNAHLLLSFFSLPSPEVES